MVSLSGFVHIEAGFNNQQPEKEIAWLESTVDIPFKSIATFDLLAPVDQNKVLLKKLSQFNSFVGVRHILDDDALTILSDTTATQNFELLNSQQVIFELQVYLSDSAIMPILLKTIENNPNINFVVNHAGFPPYFSGAFADDERNIQWQNWLSNIKHLAQYGNVWVKCSGWEMTNRQYQTSWVQSVISAIVTVFDATKVMLASNFPLTLFSTSYEGYWQQTSRLAPHKLSENLCLNNALLCYGFDKEQI